MCRTNNTISQSQLQYLLSYDPETGIFRWKVSRAKQVKVDDVAGSNIGHRYWRIKIDNRKYFAHRLAWLYTYGTWPNSDIDHINHDRADNRIKNLREVTKSQNQQNSVSSWGVSKHRGVCWQKDISKWKSEIKLAGKRYYLGLFDTEDEAATAYRDAQQRFHSHAPDIARKP